MRRNMTLQNSPHGLTLVEVLVVLFVVMVVIGVLLPFILRAREAARLTHCKNNMKQLGLAFHSYHDGFKTFPVASQSPYRTPNWRFNILWFLWKINPDDFDVTGSFAADSFAKNSKLAGMVIPIYHCPSSPLSPNAPVVRNTLLGQTHDYIGIMGAFPDIGGDPDEKRFSGSPSSFGGYYVNNGVMLVNQCVSIRDCTDGTSSTLLLAEQSGTVSGEDLRNNYFGGWSGAGWSPELRDAPASATVPNGAAVWTTGITAIRYPINSQTPEVGAKYIWDANTILNSNHPGGIHVLLADGSARFISDKIDFYTLQSLAIRNDVYAGSY